MKLITVKALFGADDTHKVDAIAQATAAQIRALPGCLSYNHYWNAENKSELFIVQSWADIATFDAYRGSPVFGEIGGALKPLMTEAPETIVYEATS
jgi:quinol monooxygenase YgiN